MKRVFILTFMLVAVAITAAYAGQQRMPFIAQAETAPAAPSAMPETPKGPAPAPAEPAPAAAQPPAAAPAPAPEAKPAVAEKPMEERKTSASARPTGKQDHQDFTKLEVRECMACHKGAGVAPNHDADWLRGHRLVAVKPNKNCRSCHDQSFCLDCHKGGGIDINLDTELSRAGTAPTSHRTDFKEIHPIAAHNNPQTCTRCHDYRFCTECHQRFRGEDLQVLSHRKGWSNLQAGSGGPQHQTFTTAQCQTCHPNGLLPQHTWSSDHSREARRNLQACQTCHSDGQTCMTCHSARTGLKVNPHPRNWDSVKDRYNKRSNGRSCIKCHDNY